MCSHTSLSGRISAGVFVLLPLLFTLFACDDYDSFTSERSATLVFSSDSVLFDTLLTTVPSSTKTLAVYNHGDKGLRISEVWLEGGTRSPFRVNIDGQDMSRSEHNRVADFEVRRRDSIIVRAEVTLPAFDSDEPRVVEDALVFRLESGIQHRIPLHVVGRDAFFMRACTLQKDTTFTARRPIVIYDSLVVAHGATLRLEPGTQLLFHDRAGLIVRGSLVAEGTVAAPVVLRGDRMDHMFDYLPYDRLPSRWDGVRLTAESGTCQLRGVDLHGGNYGICVDSCSQENLKLRLLSSRLHNLGGHGLELHSCRVEVAVCEISNTLGHCVFQIGGDAQFVNCTLVQFYPLSASRGNALTLTTWEQTGAFVPLMRADFLNCVITGYADDVVVFPALKEQDDPQLADLVAPEINYRFVSSLVATVVPDDPDYQARFQEVVLDTDEAEVHHEKHFVLMDTHNFLYDFTPVEDSPIRGLANPAYMADFPDDRLGRSRTADGAPDAGCYEWVPDEGDK